MDAIELRERLNEYRKAGAHILVHGSYIPDIPPFLSVMLQEIYISTKPEDKEAYLDSLTKRYVLHARALIKIALAAGMTLRAERTDMRNDKDYVEFWARGEIQTITGNPLSMEATYPLRVDVMHEELEIQYENIVAGYKKNPQKYNWFCKMTKSEQNEWVQGKIKRELVRKKKEMLKIAETGAKARVIRGIFGISDFSKEQLQKPFVVPLVIFKPDYSNPVIREQIQNAALQAITGVFGPAPTSQPAVALPPASQVSTVTDVDDIPEAPPEPPASEEPGIPTGTDEPPSEPQETNIPDFDTFMNMGKRKRLAAFGAMAKTRGIISQAALWDFWRNISGKPAPEKAVEMPDEDMIALYEALTDAPPAKEDDIPF